MYKKFYGLKEAPFNLTPDTKYLYLSKGHKEALAHLVYGINERKGFMLITGEIGSGKTTLCRALVNQLGENTKVALILNSFLSEIELLKSINEEFFLKNDSDSKKVLIDEFNKFLIKEHSRGYNVALIIDEAQNLPSETLEQIRMISNLETETDKLLQIVLMGQPEFNDILILPNLKQLNQRIIIRYHLEAIDKEELLLYIQHRLRVAGTHKNITFDNVAIELLYEFSNGIPRLINIVCDRCLLIGFVKNTADITAEIMKQAIDEVAGKYAQELLKSKKGMKHRKLELSDKALSEQMFFKWVALLTFIVFSSIIGYGLLKSTNKLVYVPTIDEKALLSALTESSKIRRENSTDKVIESVSSPTTSQEKQISLSGQKGDEKSPLQSTVPTKSTNAKPKNVGNGLKPLPTITSSTALPETTYSSAKGANIYPDWERDENNIVRINNRDFTQLASLATLLSLWGIDVDLAILKNVTPKDVANFDLIQFTKDAGTYRIDLQTNLPQLLSLDMPVILELDKNNLYISPYLVLIGITNQGLIVADPILGKTEIKKENLDKIWFGNTIVIFVENNITSQLSYGMKGKEIGILQQYLKRLGYFQDAITNKFDKYTTETLKKFQKDNNLPDDGICGTITLMLISIKQKDRERPVLTKDISGGIL